MDFGYMEPGTNNWPLRNKTLYKDEIQIKRIDIYEKKLVLVDKASIKLSEITKLQRIS